MSIKTTSGCNSAAVDRLGTGGHLGHDVHVALGGQQTCYALAEEGMVVSN
jgi:hypothetical protein